MIEDFPLRAHDFGSVLSSAGLVSFFVCPACLPLLAIARLDEPQARTWVRVIRWTIGVALVVWIVTNLALWTVLRVPERPPSEMWARTETWPTSMLSGVSFFVELGLYAVLVLSPLLLIVVAWVEGRRALLHVSVGVALGALGAFSWMLLPRHSHGWPFFMESF